MRARDLPKSTVERLVREGRLPAAAKADARPRAGDTPEDLLWNAVSRRFPQACREHRPIPGRRYRVDMALVAERLAIEVDGFAHHGKFLRDFRRDRVRQNLLVIAGWRVLRFAAGEIRADLDACLASIEAALAAQDEFPRTQL